MFWLISYKVILKILLFTIEPLIGGLIPDHLFVFVFLNFPAIEPLIGGLIPLRWLVRLLVDNLLNPL